MQANVLRHLVSDEHSMTKLLYALCELKPIREVVVRLFTQKKFGADDAAFEDMSVQVSRGGPLPDLCIEAEALHVVVEVTGADATGFTDYQPRQYVRELVRQKATYQFFVFLVPSHYDRQAYERWKQAFCVENPQHAMQFVELTWFDVHAALDQAGLSATCGYTRDFQQLLQEWYAPPPIPFAFPALGVTTLCNTTAGRAVSKVFACVEQLASAFEAAGFTVSKRFQEQWWQGEWGVYLQCGNHNVLFLGVWMSYWQEHGWPVCIGVNQGRWKPAVIARFQQMFPQHDIYPPQDAHPYLVRGIDPQLLTGDAVREVSTWLLQGYLHGIGALVSGHQPSIP
jgi:hypothetical protein